MRQYKFTDINHLQVISICECKSIGAGLLVLLAGRVVDNYHVRLVIFYQPDIDKFYEIMRETWGDSISPHQSAFNYVMDNKITNIYNPVYEEIDIFNKFITKDLINYMDIIIEDVVEDD